MNRLYYNLILPVLFLGTTCASGAALTNITFIAVDVETSGFNKSDRIVEIAAVKFRNGIVLENKSWLINPGIPIPEATIKVHGISNEMVAKCPAFKDIFPAFRSFIGENVLLAHNAEFDWRFITSDARRNGIDPPANIIIDNLKLARKWFPDAESGSLADLKKHLGIPEGQSHRALADSISLMKIFQAGLNKMPENMTLADLIKLGGIKNQERLTNKEAKNENQETGQ